MLSLVATSQVVVVALVVVEQVRVTTDVVVAAAVAVAVADGVIGVVMVKYFVDVDLLFVVDRYLDAVGSLFELLMHLDVP